MALTVVVVVLTMLSLSSTSFAQQPDKRAQNYASILALAKPETLSGAASIDGPSLSTVRPPREDIDSLV